MRIRLKLLASLLSVAIFAAAMGWLANRPHDDVERSIEQLTTLQIETLRQTTEVTMRLEETHAAIRAIMVASSLVNPDQNGPMTREIAQRITTIRDNGERLQNTLSQWEERLRRLRELDPAAPTHQEQVHALAEAVAAINSIARQLILDIETATGRTVDPEKRFAFFTGELEPLFARSHDLCEYLFTHERQELTGHIQTIRRLMESHTRLGWYLTAGSLLIALLLTLLLTKRIARPIELLRDAAISVGQTGKFKMDLPMNSKDEIGQLASVLFSLFHAFEQKRIRVEDRENELGRAARQLDKLLGSINDIIIVCSPKGDIERINRPEALGYAKTVLIGRSVRLVLKDSHLFVNEENPQALLKSGAARNIETTLITQQGERLPVLVTGSFLTDQNKVVVSVILVAREIGAYKQAQETLREQEAQLLAARLASQDKNRFLAAMSHEIRTPMNAIMGLTDLALHANPVPRIKGYLLQITQASRSLLRLIDDILDYSRIEAGKLELIETDFLLRDLLDHLMELFRQPVSESGVDLVVHPSRELHLGLTGDPLRLEQILSNLIGNAIKFTQQGAIEVSVKTVDEKDGRITLEISVRDSGIGMTEEQTERLFQPFQQGDVATARRHGGSGLGLAISKQLVEMLQGRIRAESIPGQGSVFRFTARLRLRTLAGGTGLTVPKALRNLRTLMADDTPPTRTALQKTLQSFGLNAHAAASGPEVLTALRKGLAEDKPFGLVILDQGMPQPDGIGTAREIQAIYRHQTVHPQPRIILLVTQQQEAEVANLAAVAGIDGRLHKPVGSAPLYDLIMELFDQEESATPRAAANPILFSEYVQRIGGARVLLVEDNQVNQQVAREMLENVGIVMDVAHNGKEAIAMLGKTAYDLVLMDIQLPVMDGLTACRILRADPAHREVPIIAMTAHAMVGDREKSLEAGMNDHLAKPIDATRLYQTLLAWLPAGERPGSLAVTLRGTSELESSHRLPAILPGIDVGACLRRFNGNHASARRVLLAAREDFERASGQMRACVTGKRQGDRENALRLAHTIRGLATTLSAEPLSQSIQALETAIREDKRGDLEALLKVFDNTLQRLQESLGTLETRQPEAYEESATIPAEAPEAIASLLKELEGFIQANDFKARATLEVIRARPWASAIREPLEQLEHHLTRFDFKSAQEPLRRILQTIRRSR
ncbi:MAG: response regulator [Magnetococcales bacterium]|nr:response regulator [Magnetococcales bacterium]